MLDLLLISALGFLGSFGHCAGMCGPLTVAFSLSSSRNDKLAAFRFHLLLNLGRIAAYALVGAAIGGLGSVLIAGGQMAGTGSELRRAIALLTGTMLIWFGVVQIKPDFLPRLPLLHPMKHDRISNAMTEISTQKSWWIPLALGLLWGLIPCGFLYSAQIKAAETGNPIFGAATMFAFGMGTLPTMLGVGFFAGRFSAHKRSQLFRAGGWVTVAIGIITLLRTDAMVDVTGHASLLCLILALIARPISQFFPQLLRYRRALGVGAFILAVAHTFHMLDHTLQWNFDAVSFMVPQHQLGMVAGMLSLLLMLPAAVTSCDRIQHHLGKLWRPIHLLSVPAFLLCALHAILIGSHYLGGFESTAVNQLRALLLGIIALSVLFVRSRLFWSILSLDNFYVSPVKQK
ncbi:MAG: sulfite exporter TauE/SafE family protein [Microcoleus sp. PH2017_10_PVI_O_A]|uniref:urease accessory protein UreH domain-containing protein n=1 Tax=unclassified Microcoleus TaxID=2642155 RepID=UPI001D910C3D|nr:MULTISPECIES: sulfite exporter TauE/SafE family protein [unclassified Microcoleus]TAE80664.1 MAG: sulfite exporter TauE/SafE family protein [Oscillatoriales cyanobacterium]MCC3407460.1 sulfite exporter TauE/SafE family protein [Microcoleus sp. PH2017_10_PVI_O_A]MCC3461548.1 sulfite exporter TauE/SafE family protein [Microcoleus sp. PH2017_11_PCY_U_A]MCC3480015.1 sulfite exporter TauE/SafE family protein [Microcoleus sp. PH2017_12_PCY_D_A]MCC3529866.1 sulfite exporter TauE/SafE family protei